MPEEMIEMDTPVQHDSSIAKTESIKVDAPRDSWGHKAEFLLASIGLAVGLGNVWRFPYLCQKNGGGAFLIPYVIFMVIEGLPLFFIEFAIGQRFRKTALLAWKEIHPALFGIGVSCVVVSLVLCIYYVIVLSWCVYYLYMSFTSNLPWDAKNCINYAPFQKIKTSIAALEGKNLSDAGVMANLTRLRLMRDNFPDCCVRDAPMWYFYHRTLQISTSISDPGVGLNAKLTICLIVAWIVTYLCVVKGIQSSGKVVYFTAVFPYVVLIILFIRGVSLEGAGIGIKKFFNPDFARLKDPQIWMDAATQMFFTLSLGFGALIAFASYMPEKNNCTRDAYTVVLINCGTSLFAGIVVFSILGYRELKTGIDATKLGSGPGLAFMTFSDALLLMDVSPFWAILFFMMLILLGIDSEFGTLEAAISPIYEMGWVTMKKSRFAAICAVVMLLFGLSMVSGPGFYIFQIFDDYSVTLPLLLIALFQVVAVSWVYGNDNFANDIEYMTGSRPNIFWLLCWKYISPAALIVVFIASVVKNAQTSPTYSAFVGCIQAPFSPLHPGSTTWNAAFEYPGWGKFLIVLVILVSTLPLLIWLVINWPKNWMEGFRKTFASGWANYHPDPSWVDPSRRKSPMQMEEEIQAKKRNQALADTNDSKSKMA
uniref:Transporter n=1 Tax=Cyanea capillata TaxID=27804 RepID=A0A482J7Q5_CYACP|nr:solute carrier family 6 [Cyanea capillata]